MTILLSMIFFVLSLLHVPSLHAEEFITTMHITKKRIDLGINENFKKKYRLKSDFFVEYDDPEVDLTKLDYSVVTLPLLMNVLTLVWASGEKYHIDAMDSELYVSLQKVKEVFKRFYSTTKWDGEFIPRRLVNNKNNFLTNKKHDSKIALLFSHGLDSLATSLRHADKDQLLITAWGHFDSPLGNNELWKNLKTMIVSFGSKFGHENTFLRSNYHNFMDFGYLSNHITPQIRNWRIEAIEGLGWAGLVAPILFCKGYIKFYIASTYCWDTPVPQAAHPLVDHNIKIADINVIHDAFDLTRAEKNAYITQVCKAKNIDNLFIRVCQKADDGKIKNCCNCEKCFRTITGFLVRGEDFKKFGFSVTQVDACKKIKSFFGNIKANGRKIDDRTICYWKEFQYFAKKNLSKNSPCKNFLEWLINFDMDSIAKIRPVDRLDYDKFEDLLVAVNTK